MLRDLEFQYEALRILCMCLYVIAVKLFLFFRCLKLAHWVTAPCLMFSLICTGFWSQQSQWGTYLGLTSNCCHSRAGNSHCLPGSRCPNSFNVRATSSPQLWLFSDVQLDFHQSCKSSDNDRVDETQDFPSEIIPEMELEKWLIG